jgi:hypothetical protein
LSRGLIKQLPEGRAGQILCIAMTLAFLGLLWLGIIAPLLDLYADGEATRTTQAAVLAHMQTIAEDLPTLRRLASAAKADRATDASSSLLAGDSDAIAAANLQNAIQDLSADAGILPTSVEVLPAVQRGAVRRIGLQIDATTSWPTLIALLKAMNDSALGLIVDDLTLHAISVSGNGGDENHPALDASFMVFAFRAGLADGDLAVTRSAAIAANQND